MNRSIPAHSARTRSGGTSNCHSWVPGRLKGLLGSAGMSAEKVIRQASGPTAGRFVDVQFWYDPHQWTLVTGMAPRQRKSSAGWTAELSVAPGISSEYDSSSHPQKVGVFESGSHSIGGCSHLSDSGVGVGWLLVQE